MQALGPSAARTEALEMIEHVLLKLGTKFEIRALRRPSHQDSLVMQYLDDLQESQRKKVVKAIELTADRGPTRNREKYESMTGYTNLFELKVKPSRIFFFYARRRRVIVMTHGFKKRGDSTPQREIETALDLRDTYFEEHDAEKPRQRHGQ